MESKPIKENQEVKLIAIYLPQFHPIPENDEWWEKGFTEWTNVTKAKPLFRGHYQPRLPADLGYYDLRIPEVREAQAELAHSHGIHGFCYYHYWFKGRRCLERPFEEVLASGKPDFPFCLCWANEDWARTWDAKPNEILIEQKYDAEDNLEHIRYLMEAFRDPRYIRVDGKPLLIVYRAALLPDPVRMMEKWREEVVKHGFDGLFLCRVESNKWEERGNPQELGFDAAIEFQPDSLEILMHRPRLSVDFTEYVDWVSKKVKTRVRSFLGRPIGNTLYDYDFVKELMLAKPVTSYLRFPCVTPSWDNSARHTDKAFILTNSDPEKYKNWLEQIVRRIEFRPPSERIVFVNAWNEWAEGNHLEPCRKWGRRYLQATREVMEESFNRTAGIKQSDI